MHIIKTKLTYTSYTKCQQGCRPTDCCTDWCKFISNCSLGKRTVGHKFASVSTA